MHNRTLKRKKREKKSEWLQKNVEAESVVTIVSIVSSIHPSIHLCNNDFYYTHIQRHDGCLVVQKFIQPISTFRRMISNRTRASDIINSPIDEHINETKERMSFFNICYAPLEWGTNWQQKQQHRRHGRHRRRLQNYRKDVMCVFVSVSHGTTASLKLFLPFFFICLFISFDLQLNVIINVPNNNKL